MIDDSHRTYGLSGDLGWNDNDEAAVGGLRSTLLLVATCAYFGAVWLLSGLPPLPFVASRGRYCELETNSESACQPKWRNKQV